MKRIILIIFILIMSLILMTSCKNVFTFREHQFGDSIEQVKKIEGDEGEIIEENDQQSLYYYNTELFNGLSGTLNFEFKNNKLQHILEIVPYYENSTIESLYTDLKKSTLSRYGNPDEESKEDKISKALWEKDEYGIVLLVTETGVSVTYSMDSSKAKKFYSSYQFMDLLGN